MVSVNERRQNQRKTIVEKAAQLFWELGYHKTTMKDIARACGFEPANLYYYFRSKEQILYEASLGLHHNLLAASKLREYDQEMSPSELLGALVHRILEVTLSYPLAKGMPDTELRNLSRAHREKIIKLRDSLDEVLATIIQDGIDSGDFTVTDAKVAAYVIYSMILRTEYWFSPNGRLSLNEVADLICSLILDGLKTKL